MPKPLRAVLVLILVIAPTLWWALRESSDGPSTPATVPAPVSSAAQAPPPPGWTAGTPTDDSERLEEEPLEEEELEEGEVSSWDMEDEGTGPCIEVEVTVNGAPAAGAHVVAMRRLTENAFIDQGSLQLDAGGKGADWCAPGRYVLGASAPGFAPSFAEIESGDGGLPPRARFELKPGHALSGRVVDADSQQPIAGARLTFKFPGTFSFVVDVPPVTTDARGAFRVSDLAPGSYHITAEAPGHSLAYKEAQVPAPEPFIISLQETSRLEGQVVDSAGAPVRGARLWVSTRGSIQNELRPGISDAQGRFSLEVEEGTWLITAESATEAGAHDGEVTVARGGLVDGLTIQLRPTGSMSGKVFARASRQPRAALVSLLHTPSRWSPEVHADEQGHFRFERLQPGRYEITVYSGEFTRFWRGDLHVQAGQELTVEIPLSRPGSLEGKVRDAVGRPVKQAHVFVEPLGEIANIQPRIGVLTDEEGHYHFEELAAGRYQLEARPSFKSSPIVQELTLGDGEAARADFTLAEASGTVEGLVERASGGAPLHGVDVLASSSSRSVSGQSPADAKGHFSLDLLPGSYTLQARYRDSLERGPALPITVEAGKLSQVKLRVPDAMTALETSGIVLDPAGAPVPLAVVFLDGEKLHLSGLTDNQGRFAVKIPGYGADTRLVVRASSHGAEGESPEVRAGSRDVVVRLRPAAALRGRVIARSPPAVQGFKLHANKGRGSASLFLGEFRPFAGDTFEVLDLPPGSIQLLVLTSDGRSGKARVQLQSGQTADVEIPVGGLGRLSGRLLSASDTPVQSWVYLDSGQEDARSAYASDDGRFELIAIEPGSHVLQAGSQRKISFTLQPDQALDLGDIDPSAPNPVP